MAAICNRYCMEAVKMRQNKINCSLPLMDPTTANALLRRLDDLELRVGASSDDEDGADLKNQVKYLQRDLHKLYETRPEIKKLTTLTEQLNLLNEPRAPVDTQSCQLTAEEKKKVLLLKYPQIKTAYNNLIELSNMDISRLINNISSLLDKTRNLGSDRNKLLRREKQIKQLTSDFHWLVVKNMCVLERYTALAIEQNEFWTDVERQMKQISTAMTIERKNQPKY